MCSCYVSFGAKNLDDGMKFALRSQEKSTPKSNQLVCVNLAPKLAFVRRNQGNISKFLVRRVEK